MPQSGLQLHDSYDLRVQLRGQGSIYKESYDKLGKIIGFFVDRAPVVIIAIDPFCFVVEYRQWAMYSHRTPWPLMVMCLMTVKLHVTLMQFRPLAVAAEVTVAMLHIVTVTCHITLMSMSAVCLRALVQVRKICQ